jgi:uncharacterized protein
MAPTHFIDAPLSADARLTLLDIARASIQNGLDLGAPLQLDPEEYPSPLCLPGASFVTLHRKNALRGCIGSLEARHPLVKDVADHAYAAAFDDPRFPRLTRAELPGLSIHISRLSPPEPLDCANEDALLAALRPGVDGLILEENHRRATFLPDVWNQLGDPFVFLSQLKYRAALPLDYWSDSIKFYRYTTESFPA